MRPGTTVFGASGKDIGTIESVDKKTFVLKTPDGPVTLSRGVISLGVMGLRVDKTPCQIRDLALAQSKEATGFVTHCNHASPGHLAERGHDLHTASPLQPAPDGARNVGRPAHDTRHFAAAFIAFAAVAMPGIAAAQDQAAVQDLFKPGAQIMGNDGKVLGKVTSIATDSFVLASPAGPVTGAAKLGQPRLDGPVRRQGDTRHCQDGEGPGQEITPGGFAGRHDRAGEPAKRCGWDADHSTAARAKEHLSPPLRPPRCVRGARQSRTAVPQAPADAADSQDAGAAKGHQRPVWR